ncbi:MAG TPA: hypothetical protein VL971_05340 [Rhizomicrobium sp.]|jgi:hypothetical protein|nr:hypothetical protein [Rhizomicrobium sp.]
MRKTACAAALMALIAGQAHAADTAPLAAAAKGFYDAYQTFHPSDGIPDAAGRAKYAPYASAGLNKMLAEAGAAEDRFAASNKDTPPLIEGDIFTSNFEGATAVKIGACASNGNTGYCAIELTYDPGKTGNPQDKPLHWIDTAHLVDEAGGWRVDDIGYGGSWDFGNKGRMRDTLKMAISEAGD